MEPDKNIIAAVQAIPVAFRRPKYRYVSSIVAVEIFRNRYVGCETELLREEAPFELSACTSAVTGGRARYRPAVAIEVRPTF